LSPKPTINEKSAREEAPLGRAYDSKLMGRLVKYLRPYKAAVVVSLVLLVLHSLLGVSGPYLTKVAVDRYLAPTPSEVSFLDFLLPEDPVDGIIVIALLYLTTLLVAFLSRYFQVHVMNLTGQRVMHELRREIFAKLQRLSVPYFDRQPIGRVVTRVTTDVDVLNELFTSGVVAIAGDILTLVFAFGVMLYLSPGLTLALLSIAPLTALVSFLFRKHARAGFRDTRVAVAKINSFLQETFTGISEIQLFNHEQAALEDFAAINEEHRRANYRTIRAHALFYPMIELIGVSGLAMLIFFGGKWVVEGTLTLGVVLAFMQYGTRVFRPIQDLAEKYNILQSAMAGAERIFQLLDMDDSTAETADGEPLSTSELSVEFRNVWFAYNDEDWVLQDVSFTAKPNEMLAVVGHTGAGKTTLVSLLQRFYEIQKGTILVGGRDIQDWPVQQLRKQFSIVLQDPYLFAGSIADNIGMNSPEIDRDAIRKAAANAHLAKYVESLPLGYDELMLERGASLSSGRKQLVGFARALAHARPFLILDEATSSVDSETEHDIRETVSTLLTGRTSIVIAHRLSTIRRADRILVMHKGHVAEIGTHQDLLAKGGIYSRLYQLQYLSESPKSA
jgi:ATP-binding cassette subfamily B multidrug efflux pump